jgi:cysteine-rich CPXCG protein
MRLAGLDITICWRSASAIMDCGFQCAGCGAWNATTVDESAGHEQSYIEDCQVCCKPNALHVRYDVAADEFVISAELE